MTVSKEANVENAVLEKHKYHCLRFICRPHRARIKQTLKSFIIVFLNDTHSV
jgi:hypothetical protein